MIKDLTHYERRVYTSSVNWVLARRGSTRVLELADDFYIRRASSDKRQYRVVFHDDPSLVYSLDAWEAAKIFARSSHYNQEEDHEDA